MNKYAMCVPCMKIGESRRSLSFFDRLWLSLRATLSSFSLSPSSSFLGTAMLLENAREKNRLNRVGGDGARGCRGLCADCVEVVEDAVDLMEACVVEAGEAGEEGSSGSTRSVPHVNPASCSSARKNTFRTTDCCSDRYVVVVVVVICD